MLNIIIRRLELTLADVERHRAETEQQNIRIQRIIDTVDAELAKAMRS